MIINKVTQQFLDNPKLMDTKYISNPKLAKRFSVSLTDIINFKAHAKSLQSAINFVESTKTVNNDKGTVQSEVESSFEPKNDIELAKLHKIDLSKYKISQYWSKLKPNGKFTSSVLATLIKVDDSVELQKGILLDEIKKYSTKFAKEFALGVLDHRLKKGNKLLEISIPDLHIGKLSHKEETGEDYDLKIATDRYKTAVKYLLKTANIEEVSDILLPIGNDLFNVDNQFSMTSGGTPQDCDSRFHKMVKAAKELLVDTITGLSAFAKVHVLIVPGNHDEITSFMLGEVLEAWFHNNDRVIVNNTAKLRKYFQWGKNGFLYTHGDKERHGDLGLIFATEESKLWADTKYRFVKLGHLHKQKKVEYMTTDTLQGFQIEILPSLSSSDKWHYGKGFIGNKQAKAYLYDPEDGEIAAYTYTV